MTGRQDSTGKLEAVIMKNLSKNANLRLNAGYLNSDVNYAQASLDLNLEGIFLFFIKFIIFNAKNVKGDDYAHSFKLGN